MRNRTRAQEEEQQQRQMRYGGEAEESNDDILTRARQSWHVPFYFPDHVHQTDRLRGLSVCIWESRK